MSPSVLQRSPKIIQILPLSILSEGIRGGRGTPRPHTGPGLGKIKEEQKKTLENEEKQRTTVCLIVFRYFSLFFVMFLLCFATFCYVFVMFSYVLLRFAIFFAVFFCSAVALAVCFEPCQGGIRR